MDEVKGTRPEPAVETDNTPKADGFREKFPATHRAADGHMVRSRAEMLIDNWLYMAEIVHAYERKLPIEEDVYLRLLHSDWEVLHRILGLGKRAKVSGAKSGEEVHLRTLRLQLDSNWATATCKILMISCPSIC